MMIFIAQARVHEELDTIFGNSDRQCTFQDTLEMKYLERVILESLRLFPLVLTIAWGLLNEDVKIGKLYLNKCIIIIMLVTLGHTYFRCLLIN